MRAPKISQYPKVVLIGPAKIPYQIKFVRNKKWLGDCSAGKQRIRLVLPQSLDELLMTFLHEVLHAIEFESGKRVKHKNIYRFEEGLYWLLKSNVHSLFFKTGLDKRSGKK